MNGSPLIFVTVGTDYHPFHRLVDWVDRWLAGYEGPPLRCMVQHGSSAAPREAEGVKELPFEEIRELCTEATVIVCQGGPASVALAREVGRRPIVVARSSRLGEHVDDHQIAFARRLDREGVATCAETESDFALALTEAIANPGSVQVPPGLSPEIHGTVARFAKIAEELLEQGSRRKGGAVHRFRMKARRSDEPAR